MSAKIIEEGNLLKIKKRQSNEDIFERTRELCKKQMKSSQVLKKRFLLLRKSIEVFKRRTQKVVLPFFFKLIQKFRQQLHQYPTMQQQDPPPRGQPSRYFRCRPSLNESLIMGSYLFDIQGTQLFVYDLQTLTFRTSIEVINKQDMFCAKMRAISDKFIGIFGMYKFEIISLDDLKIVQGGGTKIPTMIEFVEAKNSYLTILTSDEDGENKLLYFWKFSNQGKIEQTFEPFDVTLPEFQECSQDRLELSIIDSIDHHPKVYLYWKTTNNMVELDPSRRLEERYSRAKNLFFLTDIDDTHFCEITSNKINICSKKGGKEVGSFTNDKEEFKKIIFKNGQPREYYSISNQGVKRWKLENNTQPVLYTESDKSGVEHLFLNGNGELVGINLEKKYIMVWKNDKQVIIHNFPNEVIKKIMKVNDTQVCLLLQATISKELEHQFQVEKHNKMEIFDIEKNIDIAKKAVLKLEYKIDIDSAIIGLDGNVIFILNQVTEADSKKYIFKWSPLCEDKKKQSKKREIVEANKYHSIKLYPFERIITFIKGKEVEMYDLFGKANQPNSQVSLFDFNAKKIGHYDITGDIKHIELSQNNQIYALGKDKFSIYEINSNHKNRLEKIHELDVAVSFIHPFDTFIIMKKEASILIYDPDFDLVMKEEEDENITNYKILKVSDKKFILSNDQELSLWDLENESKTIINLNEATINPNLIELVGGKHLLVADSWVKSYDFYELLK